MLESGGKSLQLIVMGFYNIKLLKRHCGVHSYVTGLPVNFIYLLAVLNQCHQMHFCFVRFNLLRRRQKTWEAVLYVGERRARGRVKNYKENNIVK